MMQVGLFLIGIPTLRSIMPTVFSWQRRIPFFLLPVNERIGSRPEPGADLIASILLLPHGEVPEGRARGDQDAFTQVQSESER